MRRIAILMAALALGLAAGAQEVVTFDDANPPYMFQKDGKPAGLYVALATEAFKRAGIAADIRVAPWKRAVQAAEDGSSALGGCYSNADRLAKYDFTDGLFEETLVLIVQKGKAFKYGGVADLRGKRIGVMAGWSYGDDFDKAKADKALTADEADSDDANIRKLLAGRVDAIIMDRLAATKQFSAALAGTEILPTPLTRNATYIIFKKSLGKQAVIAKLNAALKAMRADGSYDRIVATF